jgi:hypothetical protein
MLQRSISNQETPRPLAQRAQSGTAPRSDHAQEADQENRTARTTPRGPSWDFSKIPLFPPDRTYQPQAQSRLSPPPLSGIAQRKLVVGEASDPLEHEADRIADHVMRMPMAPVQGGVQSKCEACEHDETSMRKSLSRADNSAPITVMPPTTALIVRRQWSDAGTGGAKSTQTTAPSSGWNKAATTIAGVRRIPIEGIAGGNTAKNEQAATKEAADNRAIVLIPASLDTSKPVEVLLHLHGYNVGYRQRKTQGKDDATLAPGTVRDVESDRIEQQIAASKRPIIGVLPQGTARSGFGNLNADAYVTAVLKALTAAGAWGEGVAAPTVGRVILSGHSGAGGRISEMMDEPGAPRLPSKLAEVALFDAINGPDELRIVTAWVLQHLDHDLAALTSLGAASNLVTPDQAAYLQKSLRFRAYYTSSDYRTRHEKLQDSIDRWFTANAARLGGSGSTLYIQLYDHYRTMPVHHGDHNVIMGKDDRLLDALTTLPPTIQPKVDPRRTPDFKAPELVEETVRRPGAGLDRASRAFMEARFGHDFSHVRVHADADAARSASAISARAYTIGDHVVFGPDAYAPDSDAGRRLLAHELTHVVQQGHAPPQAAEPDGASYARPAAEMRQPVRRRPAPAQAVNPKLLPMRADE